MMILFYKSNFSAQAIFKPRQVAVIGKKYRYSR
jgi:hypothetical protein